MGEFTVRYWVAWLYGLVGAAIATSFGMIVKRYCGMRKGMQGLLRSRIYDIYDKYYPMGYLPKHKREELEGLFEPYKELGGNGQVKDLVEKLYDLPTEPSHA